MDSKQTETVKTWSQDKMIEAEVINQLEETLEDLSTRSGDIRRYL